MTDIEREAQARFFTAMVLFGNLRQVAYGCLLNEQRAPVFCAMRLDNR
jgi:hypothetical protein